MKLRDKVAEVITMIIQRDQLIHTIREEGSCEDILERLELLDQATETLGVLIKEVIQSDNKRLLFGES